jgi:hypothetical protein
MGVFNDLIRKEQLTLRNHMGKGAKRNKPCNCGSGKKFKHCCEGRKPVSQMTTVDFGVPTTVDMPKISPDSKFEFSQEGKVLKPQHAWTEAIRERENKAEKKMFSIPISNDMLQVGEVSALQRYDRVFGIDTNTKIIGEDKVSMGCIAEGRFNTSYQGETFESAILAAIEVHNGPEKAENFSWHLLINAILKSPDYSSGNSYGIVTDSDLGMHVEFNSRSVPVFGDHLLHENFTLIYAHDKGASLINGLLRLCDNEAGKMLKQLQGGDGLSSEIATPVVSGVCDRFRFLKVSNTGFLKAGWFCLGEIPLQAFKG